MSIEEKNNFISNIYSEMVSKNKINIKWKTEAKMYNLIKEYFPDAIYQYRNEIFGMQSLDVYIPSINVAVEYQGIQHFEAVEFFGGDKALIQNIQRDNKKKEICKKNKIKLIEWFYYEDISYLVLKEKFKEIIEIKYNEKNTKIENDFLVKNLKALPILILDKEIPVKNDSIPIDNYHRIYDKSI